MAIEFGSQFITLKIIKSYTISLLKYCQAQPQAQLKLAELALFSIYPYPTTNPEHLLQIVECL